MPIKLSRNDIAFGCISFLNDVSSEMIFPVLPFFMVAVLGLTKGQIGLIEGLAGAASYIFMGVSGYVADRRGRRKDNVVAGYALATLTKPFFAMATTGWHAVILRFLDRAGKGLRESPRDALIAEGQVERYRGRAFGFNRTMDTLGGALGTLIVFYILLKFPGAYRPIFWISFFPGALAFLLLVLFVKEKAVKATDDPAVPRRKFDWSKLDHHCKLFYVVTTIFGLANASYAFFLLKAASLGVVGSANTLLYLVYSLVPAFLFFPIGRWTDHHGRKLALLLGYFLFALTAVSFTAANQFMVWILFAFYGASMALTDGVTRAFISDMAHPDVRGTALGIYYGLNGLALFVASAMFGYLWDNFGYNFPFIVSGILAAIAGLVFIVFIIHHSYCRRRGKTPFCEKC